MVFNESMSKDIDLSNITQVMSLTVIPDVQRGFDETFDPSHLNMDWSLSNFSVNKLEIKITFEEPDEISTFDYEDTLNIKISDKKYFKSEDQERYLSLDSTDFNITIPKQMKKNIFTEHVEAAVETITDTLKGMMTL